MYSYSSAASTLDSSTEILIRWGTETLQTHASPETRFPMIIPCPGVAMATAQAQSSSLLSESNPVQIRYDHRTEELNPLRIISQKQRPRQTQLTIQTEADPPKQRRGCF